MLVTERCGLSTGISVHVSMVSCQTGPTRHAYAWQIGPFSRIPSVSNRTCQKSPDPVEVAHPTDCKPNSSKMCVTGFSWANSLIDPSGRWAVVGKSVNASVFMIVAPFPQKNIKMTAQLSNIAFCKKVAMITYHIDTAWIIWNKSGVWPFSPTVSFDTKSRYLHLYHT